MMYFSAKIFKKVINRIRNPFRKIRIIVKHKLGWLDIPKIVACEGLGNQNEVNLTGMVIENKGLKKPEPGHSIWYNLLATIKRFSGDEIPGVKVKVLFEGEYKIAETDEFGIFSVKFRNLNLDTVKRYYFKAQLLDKLKPEQDETEATGELFIPDPNAEFGIVSDIDDTILVSHASRKLKKLWLVLFKNALTRKSFKGFPEFFQLLHKNKKVRNPIFYLSNSEWNLYDLLLDFRKHNNFPPGPLLLRPLKRDAFKLLFSSKTKKRHKLDKIAILLKLFPQMKFVFVGDSGQHDPRIYCEMARKKPERIRTIYIRRIRPGMRIKKLAKLQTEMNKMGIDMFIFTDSGEAKEHASTMGLI